MTTVKPHRVIRPIKGMLEVRIIRNGVMIHKTKRGEDLLVYRGQMIFAYLLSQGALGTSTSGWQVVASEKSVIPDMGDDSGNPLANEFNPVIGSPVNVSYDFEPSVKPSGGYQAHSDLIIDGTVICDGFKTLRKIGIIDIVAVPNKHIIFEDAVVEFPLILNDEIYIRYTIPLGL